MHLTFLEKENEIDIINENELKNHSRKRLIDKMIDAALKEKFSQLTKKYAPDLVFEVWAQGVKCQGVKISFIKWKPDMTLRQALDSLYDRFNSIEASIRKLQEKRGKKEKEGSEQQKLSR